MILWVIMLLDQQIMDSGLTQNFILLDPQQVQMYVQQEVKQDYSLTTLLTQREDMV